jgi:hypothetical protein
LVVGIHVDGEFVELVHHFFEVVRLDLAEVERNGPGWGLSAECSGAGKAEDFDWPTNPPQKVLATSLF